MLNTFKKNVPVSLLIGTCIFLTACATLVGGPSWLAVETKPDNIKVRLEGTTNGEKFSAISPFRLQLNRNSDYKLTIETPNYKSEEVIIRRSITGWFWGNILIGGLLGMGIDYLTGNWMDHNEHLLKINLESLASAPSTIEVNIPVIVYNQDGGYETKFLPIVFHKKTA